MRNLSPKLTALCIALVLCLGTGATAFAASGTIVSYVNKVLLSADHRWGGCMVYLSANPGTLVPACSGWLTFSCTGDYTDPVQAYRMVDQAQLALATNKRIQITFQDDKRHNGYCFVNRMDILR